MTTASQLPVETPPRRGHPLVAWAVIVLAVATAFVGQLVLERRTESKKQTTNVLFDMEARQLVGLAQLDGRQRAKAYEEAGQLNKGPESQRLRFVVLAGEFVGPDEALKRLHELGTPKDDPRAAELLKRLYKDYQREQLTAPSLTENDRKELEAKLGWFGELALNPEGAPDPAARAAIVGPAKTTFFVMVGVALGFIALGVVGLNLLIVMAILVAKRMARLRFTTGSANGGVYAETFALWMVLFMALGFVGAVLPTGQNHVLVSGLLALSSLAALAWPVFRGVPWRTVRREIGLVWTDRARDRNVAGVSDDAYPAPATADDRVVSPVATYRPQPRAVRAAVLEPVFGLASYAATLPLLFVGALLTLGLMRLQKSLFGEGGDASHPIVGFLLTANWWGRLQVILAASVGAPIIEETMFRGVLYRHLREATGRWGRLWSFLASAVVVSFIFAVIHPQGILAVPALMSLAIGFSMAREWRGTLVPSMVAHGLNNAMVTVLLLVSMS